MSEGCTWNGWDRRHVWMPNGHCCWCEATTDEPQPPTPPKTVSEARRRRLGGTAA